MARNSTEQCVFKTTDVFLVLSVVVADVKSGVSSGGFGPYCISPEHSVQERLERCCQIPKTRKEKLCLSDAILMILKIALQ